MKGYLRYSTPIDICHTATTKDAAGGNFSGVEIVDSSLVAEVFEKSLNRTDQHGHLVFQKIYKIDLWADPNLVITPKHYIKCLGMKLIIQNIEYDVTKLKNLLTLVSNA